MMNTSVLCLLLALTVSAEILEFDDNFVEFGPAPIIPYPYQVVEPVAAPVFNGHHNNILVPATNEVRPAGFVSTAISCMFDAVQSMLVLLLTHGPALVAGTAVALGVCKLTTFCDSQVTIYEVQSELRSLASPERLSRAVKFVTEAVKKYNEMQK